MFRKFKHWLEDRLLEDDSPVPTPRPNFRRTGSDGSAHSAQTGTPKETESDVGSLQKESKLTGKIEDAGPGKNVLVRRKFIREETGTHETLKILDDSMVDTGEETGIDPYNTGAFDRSKNWNNRFRD